MVSRRIDPGGQQIDMPARQIDLASRQIDTATRQIDLATKQIDLATKQIDMALRQIDMAPRQIDLVEDAIEMVSHRKDRPQEQIDCLATTSLDRMTVGRPPGPMRAIAHTLRVARAAAGTSALYIYAIAQRLAKRKDGAELVAHVQDMRRKLKRGRRKATSEPAPEQSVNTAPKQ